MNSPSCKYSSAPRLDDRKRGLRPFGHADRNRTVERDDGRIEQRSEIAIERGDAAPVGRGGRIGLGVAWLVVVAAEMIALRSGLGYLIMDSRNAGNRYDLVVAGMIIIGIIGLILDVAMRKLEGLKSVRWRYGR